MKWFLIATFACFTLGSGWAEEQPISLNLNDALQMAFQKSPDLKSAEARLETARGMEKQAQAEGGPQLMAYGLAMSTSSQTMIPTVSGYDPSAMFMVPHGLQSGGSAVASLPLFTGGRVSQAIVSATAGREGESFRFQAARIQLAYAVKIGYSRILLAQSNLEAAHDNLSENLETLHRAETLFKAGKVPQTDLFRAKAEASESKRKFIEAQNNLELRKIDLLRVIGLDVQTPIRITDKMQEPASLANLPTLLAEAKKERPELLAQHKEVASKEALMRSSRGDYSPQVYAYGRGDTLSGSPGQFNGTSVGLIASFPIFDSGRREGKVQEREGQWREAQQQEQALELDVSRDVIQARLNLETAAKLLEEARDAVTSAKEDLRIVRLRFDSGKAIELEILDAVTAYTRARLQKVEALYAYQVALADLDRAVGKL